MKRSYKQSGMLEGLKRSQNNVHGTVTRRLRSRFKIERSTAIKIKKIESSNLNWSYRPRRRVKNFVFHSILSSEKFW
jgi:hypothetical protein